MKNSIPFRGWYYFRMGWATYFAFIFAAVNTLTVTYYLAIERVPSLIAIFPNFVQYVVIIGAIGIPLLILIGFVHYKRTLAYKSEADVMIESNPYARRNVVNNTINVEIVMKNLELLIKLANKETISEKEMEEVKELHKKYAEFTKDRKFSNEKDLEFIKNEVTNS